MAVKMKKPDYWPLLEANEIKARESHAADELRRKLINKEDCIRIKGAREHNLQGIDLTIPRNELVVLTGLSGSGKSSLAFDTIYAEGQRRYMESLSSYARQFLGQMEKPDVEKIDGLSPAISIDQKSTNRNPRSTVGTVTEIYDYLRLLYARIGIPHCPKCGREISRQTVDQMACSCWRRWSGAARASTPKSLTGPAGPAMSACGSMAASMTFPKTLSWKRTSSITLRSSWTAWWSGRALNAA